MSCNLLFPFKCLRHKKYLKVPAAAFARAGMTGVFMAVVEYFEALGAQRGESLPDLFNHIHQGKTFIKGLTLTFAKMPSTT